MERGGAKGSVLFLDWAKAFDLERHEEIKAEFSRALVRMYVDPELCVELDKTLSQWMAQERGQTRLYTARA